MVQKSFPDVKVREPKPWFRVEIAGYANYDESFS